MIFKKQMPIEYNNKKFMVFFDENNRRTFLEIGNNGKYQYPLLEDYLCLYKKFNSHNPYDVSKFKFEEKVRVIKNGVVSLLSVITILNSIPSALAADLEIEIENDQLTIGESIDQKQNEKEYIKIEDLKDLDQFLGKLNVTKEMVIEAINNNSNLNAKYKRIAINLVTEITNNYPDFNLRIFYENIKDMKVEECTLEEFRQAYSSVKNAIAFYNTINNTITAINGVPIEVLYHEMYRATHNLYHHDENKIVYRNDENYIALGEAMTDDGASLAIPIKGSYTFNRTILNYLKGKVNYTLNDYNNKGIHELIARLKVKYPNIDINYINEMLNTINYNSVYLNRQTKIETCGELLPILFEMCLEDVSLSSGYQPFNEFAKLLYNAKDPELVFEYLEKYNQKLVLLGYTEIISKEEAMKKYNVYKDASGVGFVNNEFVPICLSEERMFIIDKNGNKSKVSNIYNSFVFDFPSKISASMFSNYDIFGTSEYWKTVSENYGLLNRHEDKKIKIYQNGELLTTSFAKDFILKIGTTKENEFGFILCDLYDFDKVYSTDKELDYLSNAVSLNNYINYFAANITELELCDVLNEEYLLFYQSKSGGFKNLSIENNRLNIEPLYKVNIKTDLTTECFNLVDSLITSQDGIISIEGTGISILSNISIEQPITLKDIFKHANVLDPFITIYKFTEEEITKMVENYLNDLSIERGR